MYLLVGWWFIFHYRPANCYQQSNSKDTTTNNNNNTNNKNKIVLSGTDMFSTSGQSVGNFLYWYPSTQFSIVFNKIPKCSSSSAASVIRTIASNHNMTADTTFGFGDHSIKTETLEAWAKKTLKNLLLSPTSSHPYNSSKLTYKSKKKKKKKKKTILDNLLKDNFVLATHHAAKLWGAMSQVYLLCLYVSSVFHEIHI